VGVGSAVGVADDGVVGVASMDFVGAGAAGGPTGGMPAGGIGAAAARR
jgi:hypothetical protein